MTKKQTKTKHLKGVMKRVFWNEEQKFGSFLQGSIEGKMSAGAHH